MYESVIFCCDRWRFLHAYIVIMILAGYQYDAGDRKEAAVTNSHSSQLLLVTTLQHTSHFSLSS